MAAKKKTRKTAANQTARKSAKKAPARKPASKAAKKKPARKKAPARKKTAARKKPASRRGGTSAVDERVEQIQRVIDVMVAAGAVEVEMREADSRLRVRLKEDPPVLSYAAAPPAGLAAHPVAAVPGAAAPEEAAPVADDPNRHVMTSPMVGTFYRAASPDAEIFCEVGDRVEEEQTLFILEAMKVMNEIKSEVSGEVLEILAQNGEPVEFGQPLFVIRVD